MHLLKRACALLVLLLIVAALGAAIVWVRNALRIDRCLDQGMRWDDRHDSCDNAHPV